MTHDGNRTSGESQETDPFSWWETFSDRWYARWYKARTWVLPYRVNKIEPSETGEYEVVRVEWRGPRGLRGGDYV